MCDAKIMPKPIEANGGVKKKHKSYTSCFVIYMYQNNPNKKKLKRICKSK